ncbi:MAG: hypothetical protein HFI11_03645 [Lachnospiraceae bacterium]|nr:hypothetical protein [Lachnospiraceae bacterium]
MDFYVWKRKKETGQKDAAAYQKDIGGDAFDFCDYGGSDSGAGGGCGRRH